MASTLLTRLSRWWRPWWHFQWVYTSIATRTSLSTTGLRSVSWRTDVEDGHSFLILQNIFSIWWLGVAKFWLTSSCTGTLTRLRNNTISIGQLARSSARCSLCWSTTSQIRMVFQKVMRMILMHLEMNEESSLNRMEEGGRPQRSSYSDLILLLLPLLHRE